MLLVWFLSVVIVCFYQKILVKLDTEQALYGLVSSDIANVYGFSLSKLGNNVRQG